MYIQLSNTKQIVSTILSPSLSFGAGALYAVITKGPVILTGTVCAVNSVACAAIQGIIFILAKNEVISAKTYVLLTNANAAISSLALLITGVSLGIIGPVAITFLALGITFTAASFLFAAFAEDERFKFAPS